MEIPGVDLKTFMAFLQYLYTDHCPIDEGEATMIMVLANQYCINRLKALCELYISKTVEKATEVSIANLDINVIGKCAVVMITIVTKFTLYRLTAQCSVA